MLKVPLPSDFHVLVHGMKITDTLSYLDQVIISHYKKELKEKVFPEVKAALAKDDKNIYTVLEKINVLYNFHMRYVNYIASWHDKETLVEKLLENLVAHVEESLFEDLRKSLKDLLGFILKFYLDSHLEEKGDENDEYPIRMEPTKTVTYKEVQYFLGQICKRLFQTVMREIHLSYLLDDDLIMSVLLQPVHDQLKSVCSDKFDQNFVSKSSDCYLGQLRINKIFPFFQLIFGDSFDENTWLKPINYLLYNSYTQIRIEEFLTIILAYPDSQEAVDDLKYCLDYTGLRPMLIKCLKKDFTKRVLNPGTKSQNIIQAYMLAVKTLRDLDPSGVVMEIVLEPCSSYLRQREDAVRQIMQDMLSPSDSEQGDLAAELTDLKGVTNHNNHGYGDERVGDSPDEWMPDSRESDPKKISSSFSMRKSDIVSLFIGMYGSKEKFIKEYQKLLSQRLQKNWFRGEDESNEVRNLELFKLRFGEEEVSKCSVMLKDFADSRRINENFKENLTQELPEHTEEEEVNFRTFIISHQFWPEMPDVEVELPPEIQESFDKFTADYERQKASRSLKMIQSCGSVDLELEFDDGIRQYKVNPIQACIILKFEEQDRWNIDELSTSLKITPTVLRKKLLYWVQLGVVKQSREDEDTYSIVDKIGPAGHGEDHVGVPLDQLDVDDGDDDIDEDKQEEELNTMWNYVKGMLSNLGSLEIDRIMSMLAMFSDENSEIDRRQLSDFLNKKVQEGQLSIEGGKYKLSSD